VSSPDDVTGNYAALMRERGWTWEDLAGQFERDANDGRALDGGANARRMARWARSHAEAGQARQQTAATEEREPRPDEATPDPRRRTTVPPTKRRA
jgi:membrane-bound lytic murein transglycosylase B